MVNCDGDKLWNGNNWVSNPWIADWSDRAFRSGESQTINGKSFNPVWVEGYFWSFSALPHGWQGVGPSPAPYRMKALQDADTGEVWQPAGRRGSGYMRQAGGKTLQGLSVVKIK